MLLTGSISQPLLAADMALKVENITDLTGFLRWSIFDSEEGYDSDTAPLFSGYSRVTSDTLRVTLHDVAAGDYAVKLFHDANNNGELDTNLLGLPQEGYGFSNNAGRFGPASYADAKVKVQVQDNTEITIRLR